MESVCESVPGGSYAFGKREKSLCGGAALSVETEGNQRAAARGTAVLWSVCR